MKGIEPAKYMVSKQQRRFPLLISLFLRFVVSEPEPRTRLTASLALGMYRKLALTAE